MLISTKSSIYPNEILGYEDFIVVGVDRNGQQYSNQAKYLADPISKSDLSEVTYPHHQLTQFLWKELNGTDSLQLEGNTSRKEWNQ